MKCQVVAGFDHLEGLVGSYRFFGMCRRSDWLDFVDYTSLTIHGI